MPGAGHVGKDGHFPNSYPNGEQKGRRTHFFRFYKSLNFGHEMKGRIELVCGETGVRDCGSGCTFSL